MKGILLQPNESHEIKREYATEITDINIGSREDFTLEVKVGYIAPNNGFETGMDFRHYNINEIPLVINVLELFPDEKIFGNISALVIKNTNEFPITLFLKKVEIDFIK